METKKRGKEQIDKKDLNLDMLHSIAQESTTLSDFALIYGIRCVNVLNCTVHCLISEETLSLFETQCPQHLNPYRDLSSGAMSVYDTQGRVE